jgi:hypothetical protein
VPKYSFWEEILLGELHQPRNELVDEEKKWDVGKPSIISMKIPCDILKSSLLWFIWCQKCK